jgi:hypothetical protein
MSQIKYPIITILMAIFLFNISCTNDNSITNSADRYLTKFQNTASPNTKNTEPDDFEKCLSLAIEVNPAILIFLSVNETPNDHSAEYNFRDNYLEKTNKGREYKSAYYELSKYAIKNNLINRYFKEHYELLNKSIQIANTLQYGDDNNKILIEYEISTSLKEMLKVYREHPNHRDIDPVLEYLEADLEKYYNKPKSEIAFDFK